MPECFVYPGPDGSSAFLVVDRQSVYIRLPRGEYELDFHFDPDQNDLPPLLPATPGQEHIKLRFFCLSGPGWPLPRQSPTIPPGIFDQEDAVDLPPIAIEVATRDEEEGQ